MSPQELLHASNGKVSVVDGYLYIMDYGHDDHKAMVRVVCCSFFERPS
jgi:hypothetical protein